MATPQTVVSFVEPGSLGLKLVATTSGACHLVGLNPGTQAERHGGVLRPGRMVVSAVAGRSVVGMSYSATLGLIKAGGRPLELAFVEGSGPEDKPDAKPANELLLDGVPLEFALAKRPRDAPHLRYRGRVVATQPSHASTELTNAAELSGAVAVAHRGECTFAEKARRAAAAGAVALLVVNAEDWEFHAPVVDGVELPVLMVRQSAGAEAGELTLTLESGAAAAERTDAAETIAIEAAIEAEDWPRALALLGSAEDLVAVLRVTDGRGFTLLHSAALKKDVPLVVLRKLVDPEPATLASKVDGRFTPFDCARQGNAAPECLAYLSDENWKLFAAEGAVEAEVVEKLRLIGEQMKRVLQETKAFDAIDIAMFEDDWTEALALLATVENLAVLARKRDERGGTLLHSAATKGDVPLVVLRQLVEAEPAALGWDSGAGWNAGITNLTPFAHARSQNAAPECLAYLSGENWKLFAAEGAVEAEVVEKLRLIGEPIWTFDAIKDAVNAKDYPKALALLAAGLAEVLRETDEDGYTLLHMAAEKNDVPLALLRKLVEPEPTALVAKDENGWTPLDLARDNKTAPECLAYLTGENWKLFLVEGAVEVEVVEKLRVIHKTYEGNMKTFEEMRRALGWDTPGEFGQSGEVEPDYPKVLALLAAPAGAAAARERGDRGWTLLHLAVRKKDTPMSVLCKLVDAAPAALAAKTGKGKSRMTPLDWAIPTSTQQGAHPEVIQLLSRPLAVYEAAQRKDWGALESYQRGEGLKGMGTVATEPKEELEHDHMGVHPDGIPTGSLVVTVQWQDRSESEVCLEQLQLAGAALALDVEYKAKLGLSYDDWLVANGCGDKKEALVKPWRVEEGKDPLRKLSTILQNEPRFAEMLEELFPADESMQARLIMKIFQAFDGDADGKLNQGEYEEYLKGVGACGRHIMICLSAFSTPNSDFRCGGCGSSMAVGAEMSGCRWCKACTTKEEDECWPKECQDMECSTDGITKEKFQTILYGKYRTGKARADFESCKKQGLVMAMDGDEQAAFRAAVRALPEPPPCAGAPAYQISKPAAWVLKLAVDHGADDAVVDALCEICGSLAMALEGHAWASVARLGMITRERCLAESAEGRSVLNIATAHQAPEGVQKALLDAHLLPWSSLDEWLALHGWQDRKGTLAFWKWGVEEAKDPLGTLARMLKEDKERFTELLEGDPRGFSSTGLFRDYEERDVIKPDEAKFHEAVQTIVEQVEVEAEAVVTMLASTDCPEFAVHVQETKPPPLRVGVLVRHTDPGQGTVMTEPEIGSDPYSAGSDITQRVTVQWSDGSKSATVKLEQLQLACSAEAGAKEEEYNAKLQALGVSTYDDWLVLNGCEDKKDALTKPWGVEEGRGTLQRLATILQNEPKFAQMLTALFTEYKFEPAEGLKVVKGVAVRHEGRLGTVNDDPDYDDEVELMWIDGSKSDWIKVDELKEVGELVVESENEAAQAAFRVAIEALPVSPLPLAHRAPASLHAALQDEYDALGAPPYSEWRAEHERHFEPRREALLDLWYVEDGKDPLGTLARWLFQQKRFEAKLGLIDDEAAQAAFRAAVVALPQPPPCEGARVVWPDAGRAGVVTEVEKYQKWECGAAHETGRVKVKWLDDSSESDWITPDQLHANACCTKNSQGQLPIDLAVALEDPPEHILHTIGLLIEMVGGIDVGLDADKRTTRSILTGAKHEGYRRLAERWGTFLGRYKLSDDIKHNTGTCLVIFAEDLEKDNMPVALKLMHNEDEWLREKAMRKLPNGNSLDSKHVVRLLEKEKLEEDAGLMDSRLKGEDTYHYLLVMPQAKHDLNHELTHYRVAGRNLRQVTEIAFQVGCHLKYLAKCGRIQGDLKPRNLVLLEIQTDSGTVLAWTLIDMDASCAIGELAGLKLTSSAFFCPEMARQQLAKVAAPTREADLTKVISEKSTKLETAMATKDMNAVALLAPEVNKLKAELRHIKEVKLVKASIQLEMWSFGVMLYQLSTEDGRTLWDANQADHIDDEQLRQLAYQWPEIKAAKLNKIVWPKAAHLVGLLLHEDPSKRPKSWDQVMQHPFLASEGGPATHKRIVMSCPEMGTINPYGTGPYEHNVMEKVSELQQIGYVKFGFDRANTSTAREKDGALFGKAFALRDEGKRDEAIELLKSTDWWYGYQTSVKQAVKLESQGFDGVLDVTCINGGFITQLEGAEMERIMLDAKSDCLKSGITVRYTITEVSYSEFLAEYEPVAEGYLQQPEPEPEPEPESEPEPEPEPEPDRAGAGAGAGGAGATQGDVKAQLARLQAQLAQAQVDLAATVAVKDKELAQAQAELAALRARVPSEGVPPL